MTGVKINLSQVTQDKMTQAVYESISDIFKVFDSLDDEHKSEVKNILMAGTLAIIDEVKQ